MPHLYTVLTKLNDDDMVKQELLDLYPELFKKIFCVVEYGVNNNNKHYNIVYEIDDEKYSNFYKSSKRFWMKIYDKDFLDTLTTKDYLIKTKRTSNYENIIGGYLQKEDNPVVLLNRGYDIPNCVLIANKNKTISNQPKSKNIYDFIDNKVLPYLDSKKNPDPKELCNLAFFNLYKNNDPDALYYSRTHRSKLILNVVRSKLNQDFNFDIFTAFD